MVNEQQAQAAMARIAAVMPALIVKDADEFDRLWRHHRGEIPADTPR